MAQPLQLPFYIWSGIEKEGYFQKADIEIYKNVTILKEAAEIFDDFKTQTKITNLNFQSNNYYDVITLARDHLVKPQKKISEFLENQDLNKNSTFVAKTTLALMKKHDRVSLKKNMIRAYNEVIKRYNKTKQTTPTEQTTTTEDLNESQTLAIKKAKEHGTPDNFKGGINPHEICVTFVKYYIGDNKEALNSKDFNEFVHKNVETNSYYCLLPGAVNLYDTFDDIQQKVNTPQINTEKVRSIIGIFTNTIKDSKYERLAIEPLGFMFNNIDKKALQFLSGTDHPGLSNMVTKLNERISSDLTLGNRLYIGDPFHYRAVNFALTNLNSLFYNSILPELKKLVEEKPNQFFQTGEIEFSIDNITLDQSYIERAKYPDFLQEIEKHLLFPKIELAIRARKLDSNSKKDHELLFNFFGCSLNFNESIDIEYFAYFIVRGFISYIISISADQTLTPLKTLKTSLLKKLQEINILTINIGGNNISESIPKTNGILIEYDPTPDSVPVPEMRSVSFTVIVKSTDKKSAQQSAPRRLNIIHELANLNNTNSSSAGGARKAKKTRKRKSNPKRKVKNSRKKAQSKKRQQKKTRKNRRLSRKFRSKSKKRF